MLDLRNQFIFSPVKTGYSDASGKVNDRHLSFYRLRSRHVGAVAPEPLYLDKGLREIPSQIGIDADDKIPGLKNLTDMIHSQGAKVIAHLNHPGRMVNPKIPGNYFISSVGQACENGGAVPRMMDRDDMNSVKELFRDAAVRAEKSGFDILELQFGHGYLLAQFISPAVNTRTDEFGGSFENRLRFPLEVFDAVEGAVDLPVIVRISGDEMIPNGLQLDEMVGFSKILSDRGATAVHVSAGTICSTPPWFFQHMFVPKGKTWDLARTIREGLREAGSSMPVIFVGRVNSKTDVDKLLMDYQADFVAVGRGLVADHDFVDKYFGEIDGPIRPCLACAEGCLGGVKAGEGLHCVVNPLAGHETEVEFEESPVASEDRKHFAVVGGGPAGMEAALTLHGRGHQVDLFEKDSLGGQMNLAWLPPNKQSLKEIVDYYIGELERQDIKVLREEADFAALANNGYHAVVLATGSEPVVPPIRGLKEFFWTEFLHDENLPESKNIVVIGGGLIGVELASKLVDRQNRVTIVEMLPEIANGMEMIEKSMTLKKLSVKQVQIYTNYRVQEIDGSTVKIVGEDEILLENIDHIVVTTGMRSRNHLKDELESSLPVYTIGDADKVGKAQSAILSGRLLGLKL